MAGYGESATSRFANVLKILHNFVDIHQGGYFSLNNVIKTRGNSPMCINTDLPNARVDAPADFVLVLVITAVWNKLSDDIVNPPRISKSTYKLKKLDLSFAFISE